MDVSVEAMGADGTIVFRAGQRWNPGRRFLSVRGQALADLGPDRDGTVVYRSGALYVLDGRYVMRIVP